MKYYAIQKSNTLTHHGIKGMRWGVRRYQDYDGHRIGSARRSKLSKSRRRLGSQSAALTDLQKALRVDDHKKEDKKIPWAALGTIGMTTLSAAKLLVQTGGAITNPIVAGVVALDVGMIIATVGRAVVANGKVKKVEEERAQNTNVDKKTGLKLKQGEMTREEDVKRVNPGFKNLQDNTKNNCALCTVAYDLRRRGYDVTADKAGIGYTFADIKRWYPKTEIKNLEPSKAAFFPGDDFVKQLNTVAKSQGDGARGNLLVQWKKTYGGHSMAYEVHDGKVQVIDGQTGKIYRKESQVSALLDNCRSVSYARLDNVEPDWKEIKECVKS